MPPVAKRHVINGFLRGRIRKFTAMPPSLYTSLQKKHSKQAFYCGGLQHTPILILHNVAR
jgi:hypothetical protein